MEGAAYSDCAYYDHTFYDCTYDDCAHSAPVDVLDVHGAVDEEAVLHHRVEARLVEAVDAEARPHVLDARMRALSQPLDL
eukprot:scaffold72159_cov60-Phaeocystis_antarctica.AAC.1